MTALRTGATPIATPPVATALHCIASATTEAGETAGADDLQAPSDIPVHRTEIHMAIQREHEIGGDREDAGSEVGGPLRELDAPT